MIIYRLPLFLFPIRNSIWYLWTVQMDTLKANCWHRSLCRFYSKWLHEQRFIFSFMLPVQGGLVGAFAPPGLAGFQADDGGLTILSLHRQQLLVSLVTSMEEREQERNVLVQRGDTFLLSTILWPELVWCDAIYGVYVEGRI